VNSTAESIQYPQYRKYKNGLSYFKILSLTQAQEIKVVGSKRLIFTFEAKQYPERVFINDLLFNYAHFAIAINEEEFNRLV
jgi:hypothetical protein